MATPFFLTIVSYRWFCQNGSIDEFHVDKPGDSGADFEVHASFYRKYPLICIDLDLSYYAYF